MAAHDCDKTIVDMNEWVDCPNCHLGLLRSAIKELRAATASREIVCGLCTGRGCGRGYNRSPQCCVKGWCRQCDLTAGQIDDLISGAVAHSHAARL